MYRTSYKNIVPLFLIALVLLSSCRKGAGVRTLDSPKDSPKTIFVPVTTLRAQGTNVQLNTDTDREDQVTSIQVINEDLSGNKVPITSQEYYTIPSSQKNYEIPFIIFQGFQRPIFIANLPKDPSLKRADLKSPTNPMAVPALGHLVPPFIMTAESPIIQVDQSSSPIVIKERSNSAIYNQILLERTVASVDVRVRNDYPTNNEQLKNITLYKMEVVNVASKIRVMKPSSPNFHTNFYLLDTNIKKNTDANTMYFQSTFRDSQKKLGGFDNGDFDQVTKRIYLPENYPDSYDHQTFIKLYFKRQYKGSDQYKSFLIPVGDAVSSSVNGGVLDTSEATIHNVIRNRNYQYTVVIKEWEKDWKLVIKTYFVDWTDKKVDDLYFE